MLKNKIADIAFHRMLEMLFGCIIPSVFICVLCVSGPMPVGSIQRDVALIGAPILFLIWNIRVLRRCYKGLGGKSLYYYSNLYGYGVFALVNMFAYIFLPTDAYTWIFVITRFGRYADLGITSPVAIFIFHFLLFASIFLAPIGLGWVKIKAREEELRERAPGFLEVNPLEKDWEISKENKEESQKISEKILCSDCKTGQESLETDPTSATCPYISCYESGKCSYYEPVAEKGNDIKN